MKRRTVLRTLASAAALSPFGRLELLAQAPPITPAELATLRAIAEVVLPSAIGAAGRDEAVASFVAWIRNYREGADRGHGYGASTLAPPAGPSPASRYAPQFAALDRAAAADGAASFAALPLRQRRAVVEAALNAQPVQRLPARPTGADVIADFMGHYFNSPAAFDLAYDAAIERDACRGLDGSDRAPGPRRR